MQLYSPSLRQVPNKASILKNTRVYKNIAKTIRFIRAFDSHEAENIASVIIYIVIILAVGGFIAVYLFGVLGNALPTISQNNILYNATVDVLHGMQSLGNLFTSGINLIAILILISVVSVIISLVKRDFGGGKAGT